ncbi:hypothetical protein CBR_g54167 [Chara braunii]|uniref:CCHC-type domain-containing protein n=1 Tax=Chara braunii TaxID=69332 RepID=A0A388K741_CHABU|nr:hypothetical protein CBR_g54167 [Chara braunii]|eukprot:GBG65875.1 hypothetical protein CBR_g54167 [Chara braunii]
MMELTLASSHSLVEDMRTIEEGPGQVERHEDLVGGMYLLVNTLLQESLDQSGSLNAAGNVDEVPESQDDEFEEGEIKEAFRAEEYDGIYLELGLLLSCEMRLRDASDRAQRMLQRYLVRDDHLFVRREVGNPRRVVCGRNRQIDVIAALHDGIAGGHRGVQATYAKISELYYWDEMMDMVGKFCRSCVPCQERSRLRQGESLHPRLEREVGVVVHLELLFMPLGDQGYNYIFDARDNLSGFVDGRAIRTKLGSVLVSCIEEYYLRYPFVRVRNGQGIRVYLPGGARTAIKVGGIEERIQEASDQVARSRMDDKARWDQSARVRKVPLTVGDVVLLYDSSLEKQWSRKLDKRWLGPYRIIRVGDFGAYQIEELNGTEWKDWVSGTRLKKFVAREERSEAAGALPGQPPSAPAKALEILKMWRNFWEQRGEELPSPTRAGFGVARKAEERLDRKIKFLAKTTFDRHLLLESDLAGKKTKEAGHGVRLKAMEVEIQELRALVASKAAIIESLRQQSQGKVDKPESSRQRDQRRPGHGLLGQPSAAEPRQEPPMGRVILGPEEARAQREAEREAFEFRAPTELATLPIAATNPVIPLAVEEGLPPSNSESAQGSAEGSMGVLLEAVHTMQEETSLFSLEQRIEEPLVREMGIEAEGVIKGGLQRLGTPEYGPEGIEDQPGPSTQEVETGEEPLDMPQSHELSREASEAPSSLGSQRGKKRFRKWFDTPCFFCTKEGHRAFQCPKFLKDKAEGKVTEEGGRMYDRQGMRVERSADGGRAQLHRQNQEEMSEQD